MKLKTELRYSRIYNRLFDKDFSWEKIINLRKDCEKFEKLYNENIENLLRLIEKNHLKYWKYDKIPIYIVNEKFPFSFSDPLTLKYHKNPRQMFVVLSHELLHNNLGKKKFKNKKELHIYMEPILNSIIKEMPINLNKELDILNKKIFANRK